MWKWLTEGRSDSSRLFGALMQVTVAALLLYAASSGSKWLFFSIPCASLLLAGVSVHFGGLGGGVRVRYVLVGRRPWRNGRDTRVDLE